MWWLWRGCIFWTSKVQSCCDARQPVCRPRPQPRVAKAKATNVKRTQGKQRTRKVRQRPTHRWWHQTLLFVRLDRFVVGEVPKNCRYDWQTNGNNVGPTPTHLCARVRCLKSVTWFQKKSPSQSARTNPNGHCRCCCCCCCCCCAAFLR